MFSALASKDNSNAPGGDVYLDSVPAMKNGHIGLPVEKLAFGDWMSGRQVRGIAQIGAGHFLPNQPVVVGMLVEECLVKEGRR
jgi:hypothetical protein